MKEEPRTFDLEELTVLLNETDQLNLIFVTSIQTAKQCFPR